MRHFSSKKRKSKFIPTPEQIKSSLTCFCCKTVEEHVKNTTNSITKHFVTEILKNTVTIARFERSNI